MILSANSLPIEDSLGTRITQKKTECNQLPHGKLAVKPLKEWENMIGSYSLEITQRYKATGAFQGTYDTSIRKLCP